MEDFVFQNPTKIIFGKGTERQLGEELAQYKAKVLLHYGSGSIKKSGLYDRVVASLTAAKIEFVELGGVKPNPRLSLVQEGIELCRKEKIGFILAVGGGSVIDSAKAIALGVPYDGDVWDFFEGKVPEKSLPVGTILTIPAAGSESSSATVITKEEGLVKTHVSSPLNYPAFSILNPELCFTLPKYQVGCGAADMFAHLLERYFTITQNVALTDQLLEGAMRTVIEQVPKVLKNVKDYDAWSEVMLSGMVAHNNWLGIGRLPDWGTHAVEHELSALYDVAHGAGLAAVFPAWLTFQLDAETARIARWARKVWGVEESQDIAAAKAGIEAFKEWLTSIGMPISLAQLEVPTDRLEEMAKRATANGPVGMAHPLKQADVLKIIELAK